MKNCFSPNVACWTFAISCVTVVGCSKKPDPISKSAAQSSTAYEMITPFDHFPKARAAYLESYVISYTQALNGIVSSSYLPRGTSNGDAIMMGSYAGEEAARTVQAQLLEISDASRAYWRVLSNWPNTILEIQMAQQRGVRLILPEITTTNDGWDHSITYQAFDSVLGYGKVISLGRDGRKGGEGVDMDVEVRFPNRASK